MADNYGYAKRPLWQWIALYVVIAGIVYAAVYYFFFAGKYTTPAVPNTGAPSTQSTFGQPAPMAASVAIANMAYAPVSISVKAGTTITWTNNDMITHTVTSDSGAFTAQTLQPGQSYSHTFNTAGTFAYHCTIHPNMHGTVTVTQ